MTGTPRGDRQARDAEDAAAVITVLTALHRSVVPPADDPAPQSFWAEAPTGPAAATSGGWSAGPGRFWASGLPR